MTYRRGCGAGLHMYSLNQDKSVVAILERLGMVSTGAPRTEGKAEAAKADADAPAQPAAPQQEAQPVLA